MYILNKQTNKLEPVPKTSFKAVGIRERKDLQEWIAKNPEVLAEELLIIQKEFAGFSDTHERLDLLALDKQGNLVIIENKLDDSGRDVVWQALKYASYCSRLDNENIKEMFGQYLKDSGRDDTADQLLEEFFGSEDYNQNLNKGNSQRIIMVSGDFRKEVTSTVLWLLIFGLRIQCFNASAFKGGDNLFFSMEQIIPMKDAEDYTISMAHKNLDDLSTKEEMSARHSGRHEFWAQFLREFAKHSSLAANISPSTDQWIGLALGMSGVGLNVVISHTYARAEIYINRGSREENKKVFAFFHGQKEKIESEFGKPLIWERMDEKVSSRIKYQLDGVNAYEREEWPKINKFLIETIPLMHKAFEPKVKDLRQILN